MEHTKPGIRFDATFVVDASEVNYERNFRVQNRTVELALPTPLMVRTPEEGANLRSGEG